MIEARGLTKRYGALVALDSLSLDVGPGEVYGFIGPNGAGKSTTMKILACLMRPDKGTARVAGYDIATDGDKIRRSLGYMPDFLGVYDDLNVDEYLQFFGSAYGIDRRRRRVVIDQVLELTDLTQKKKSPVDGLSRGMQQRLGVARVLLHDPKVLLLDEPSSGLDPRARIEMRELLTELGRMGKSLMISSHILSELAEMCTCIGIIERGKLLFTGSIQEAYARTRGNERIRIRLEPGGPDAASIASVLEQSDRVSRATVEPAPEGQPAAEITIDLVAGEHAHHFLIEQLLRAGARIASFSPETVKLEDAFLKLTTGALQ